ncbi:MAG: hypothetical protein HY774_13620 [Acidobacteria bacterium]|nr:hypothetical protein [Acidobacteriota bacterium]
MASSDPISTLSPPFVPSDIVLPHSNKSDVAEAVSGWYFRLNQIHPVWIAAILFGIITLVGYGKSRNYTVLNYKAADYILEDRAIRFLDWEHVSYIFTTVQQLGYTPIPRLSFALDWALWGTDPAGYRGTNFLLFWFGVTLVFLFFYEVTTRRFTAWVIALCFAVHPAQIESVVWLAGRKDVLATVFGFAALWMYRRAVVNPEMVPPLLTAQRWPRWVWYFGSLILFILALLTKIQWAGLCLVILALDIYERRLSSWRVLPRYIPFLAVGGFLFGLTLKIQIAQTGKPPLIDIGAVCTRIDRFVLTLWHMIWPMNLVPAEPDPFMSTWFSILGLGVLALILAEASSSLRKGRREIFFATVWLLAFLAPWASFAGISIMGIDRVMSVIVIGILFPLAMGISRLSPKVACSIVATVIIFLAISTFRTISMWEKDCTVWRAVVTKYPTEVFALANLVYAETEAGNLQEAQKAYQRGLKITETLPTIYPALYGAGAALAEKLGDEPLKQLQVGFRDAPYQPQLMSYAGQLEISKGRWDRAEYFFLVADRIEPSAGRAGVLAQVYLMLNKPDKGLGYIQVALKNDPFQEDHWLLKGKLSEASGKLDEAKAAYHRSIALAPNLIEPRFHLAQLAFRQNHFAETISLLNLDSTTSPHLVLSASALDLLATAYQKQGKPALALATMIQVTQKEDNPDYWIKLARLQLELHQDPGDSLSRALACDPERRQGLAADPSLAPFLGLK